MNSLSEATMLLIVCVISSRYEKSLEDEFCFHICHLCLLFRLYLRIVLGSVNVSLLSKHDKYVAQFICYFVCQIS